MTWWTWWNIAWFWLTHHETIIYFFVPLLVLLSGAIIIRLVNIIFKRNILLWIVKLFKYIFISPFKRFPYRIINKNKYITIKQHNDDLIDATLVDKTKIWELSFDIKELQNSTNIPDIIVNIFVDPIIQQLRTTLTVTKWWIKYELEKEYNRWGLRVRDSAINTYFTILSSIKDKNTIIREKITKESYDFKEVYIRINGKFSVPKWFENKPEQQHTYKQRI